MPPVPNEKKPRKTDDDTLVREIRNNFEDDSRFWAENYKQGDLDMECLSAEHGPWPADEARRRKDAERPIVHIDICTQYLRRIVNQARMNPRGILITPQGSDSNDKTATMREDRIRQIDVESMAVQCRLGALENAVNRGLGFYMVTTDWSRSDAFDLKIGTRYIPNPKSVLPDPYFKKPDLSDLKRAFILDRFPWGPYRKEHPDATVRSFDDSYLNVAPSWMDEKSIQVAEYWKVQFTPRKRLLLHMPEGPQAFWEDEWDGDIDGDTLKVQGTSLKILKQRQVQQPIVWQYITNGFEILKRLNWTESCGGTTIPLIVVTGLRKYENGKLVIESATRKMRAPQLLYDYATTCEQEVMGGLPKPHWKAYFGQTEEFDEWEDANRQPVSVLRQRATTEESRAANPTAILPPPEFESGVDPAAINVFEQARQSAIIACQQAAGMFSVDRQQAEERSGILNQQLNTQQDLGNYHFADYLDLAIQNEGRIKNEILRHVEDTVATRGFRKADDTYTQQQVQPMADPETGELTEHPYGKGRDHDVVVKAGPSMQSQWEKASEFLDQIAQNPQYGHLIMDLVVQMKQLGPMGETLADRFAAMLPPGLQKQDPNNPQPPIPPQIMQQMQQMKQLIQQQAEELKTKQVEWDSRMQMNRENNDTKIAVAAISAKVEHQSDQVSMMMQKLDHMFDIIEQQHAQGHEMAMAAATPPPPAPMAPGAPAPPA